MAFEKAPNRIPTSVPIFRMIFTRRDTDEGPDYAALYELVLLDQYGQRIPFGAQEGDLVPHLTANQRSQLMALIDALHQKAKNELLS